MTTLILLSAEDADAVRGTSAAVDWAALAPVALTDGRFILNVSVLTDPAHEAHWELLATLPQADLADIAHLIPQPAEE